MHVHKHETVALVFSISGIVFSPVALHGFRVPAGSMPLVAVFGAGWGVRCYLIWLVSESIFEAFKLFRALAYLCCLLSPLFPVFMPCSFFISYR